MKLFKITRCRLLLALLICLGAGASSGQTAITIEANQKILLSGMRVEFGSIDIGGYKTQSFTVTNASLSTVTGLTCTLDGADAADFVLSTPTLADLAVGAAASFSVTYVPELVGKVSASVLHVRSSGGSSFELPLTATGGNLNPTVLVEEVGGAVVTSLSRPLDFGSPMIGQSTSKTFRITNTGTAPLRAVSVARDDPWYIGSYRSNWGWLNHDWGPNHIGNSFYYDPTYQYESGFTVTGLSSSIAPGESRTITVTWVPYETVQKTRNITLSWAMRAPPPTYDLTGSSSVQFVLSTSVFLSRYSPIIPYIPPVRFSIPVTGAAVPYALDLQLLTGLEFHLGNENGSGRLVSSQSGATPSDPMLGPTFATAPDDAILTTGTLARWNPSAPAADHSNDWRSHTQRYLTISAPIDFEERPLSVFVTGDGSAAQALRRRWAVASLWRLPVAPDSATRTFSCRQTTTWVWSYG
ncbi:MAG: choice-of-anchor D domain-containing protein [Verrucomicrobia bacterium]|nr:choice-of-anchor D domain-containing protein [Verrucomicrobiota bacterium]